MQQPQATNPIVQVIASIIQFGILGFVGAVPLGLIVSLMYGPLIGREIWFLGAVLIGSYFPLRAVIGSIVHGQSSWNFIPKSLNFPMLILGAMAFLFMIPVIWFATFTALVVGLVSYAFIGQNLIVALLISLGFQAFDVFRQIQNSPQINISSNFVMNFQDLSERFDTTLVIDPSSTDEEGANVQRAPDVVYHLPDRATSLHDTTDDEEVIIFEPEDKQDQSSQQD